MSEKIDISSGPVAVGECPVKGCKLPMPHAHAMPAAAKGDPYREVGMDQPHLNPKPHLAKDDGPHPMVEKDLGKLWQVHFKSGQGQQVHAATADDVAALMVKHYGKDYEIANIAEIVPIKP